MKEEARYWLTAFLAYGSWAAAIVLTFLRLSDYLDAQYGTAVIFLIGVAMASGIKLSRMRLTATMIAVFQAGAEATRRETAAHRAEDAAARIAEEERRGR